MNEDSEVVAEKDNVEHKNAVAQSSTAPVLLKCNVSDVYSQVSLQQLCLC